jgi:hypothetical protein
MYRSIAQGHAVSACDWHEANCRCYFWLACRIRALQAENRDLVAKCTRLAEHRIAHRDTEVSRELEELHLRYDEQRVQYVEHVASLQATIKRQAVRTRCQPIALRLPVASDALWHV